MNYEQVVFIPMDIWRIKNLNFIEKVILSEVVNMTVDHKGKFNKHKGTIANDFRITEAKVESSFKKLKQMGFIESNRKLSIDQYGKIKGCKLVTRVPNLENIKNAEKFNISKDNIFTKGGRDEGFTFTYWEIFSINSWNRKITRDSFLALYTIFHKNSFKKEYKSGWYCRFKKTDLYEVLGLTRATGRKIADWLFTEQTFNSKYKGAVIVNHLNQLEYIEYRGQPEEEDWVINIELLFNIDMFPPKISMKEKEPKEKKQKEPANKIKEETEEESITDEEFIRMFGSNKKKEQPGSIIPPLRTLDLSKW